MSVGKLYSVLEKIGTGLIVGLCMFGVSYLRSIDSKLSLTCERVSFMDAQVGLVLTRLNYFRTVLDQHEARLDIMSQKQGG